MSLDNKGAGKSPVVLGLVMGDAAGVGAEIIAKALFSGKLQKEAVPVVIGDIRQLRLGMRQADAAIDVVPAKSLEDACAIALKEAAYGRCERIAVFDTGSLDADHVTVGQVSAVCGEDAARNMRLAAEGCMKGLLDGFCFGPNNKTSLKMAGYHLNGMVDFLAGLFGYEGPKGEININGEVFNARVTGHIPVQDIPRELSEEKILRTIRLLWDTLLRFGKRPPRIAVAALNPHGGENGTCGREELDVIMPALERARKEGFPASGPFAADTLFGKLFKGEYDGAVTMYHDQGQIAFKLINFDQVVTVYGGIPWPVGTGAHGTAYDIAGKGIADPGALTAAYRTVARMAENRRMQ